MQRRREHSECERTDDSLGTGKGRGCLVYGTKGPCKWRKEEWGEWAVRVCEEVGGSVRERMDWFAWAVVVFLVAWAGRAAWRGMVGGEN